jgi:hypothetical protein
VSVWEYVLECVRRAQYVYIADVPLLVWLGVGFILSVALVALVRLTGPY